ncbi:MAG: hypothetical protein R6U50_16320, partial [Desulfobacterales bacterium]
KTPMAFAEVLVFSPKNDKIEHQNGRTDQNGRFAFLADIPGKWQVKVNDGMGHAVHATVTVIEPKTAGEFSETGTDGISEEKNAMFAEASMGTKLFLGLSILLNLVLGAYVWRRKKQEKP